MITLQPANDRGFLRGQWNDIYGQPCMLQESSLAETDAIWLGSPEGVMHLNRWQAAILVDQLQQFIATGFLRRDQAELDALSEHLIGIVDSVVSEEDKT